jgi:hypothetical protein
MDYISYLFGWFSGIIVGLSLGAYIDREWTRIKWNNNLNETIKLLQSPVTKTLTEILCNYCNLSGFLYPTRTEYPFRSSPTSPFSASRPTVPPSTQTPSTSSTQTPSPSTSSTQQTPSSPTEPSITSTPTTAESTPPLW